MLALSTASLDVLFGRTCAPVGTITAELSTAAIEALLTLPVSHYELGDGLAEEDALELSDAIRKSGSELVSVAGFVPRPEALRRKSGLPAQLLSLSSLDGDRRECAVAAAISTLEFAARCEAATVVASGGAVELDLTTGLESLEKAAKGRRASERQRLAELVAKKRSKAAAAHLDALCRSMDRVLDAAERFEVSVAVTNPASPAELPDVSEWSRLRSEFRGSRLCATVNLAHVHYREWLGYETRADFANAIADEDDHPFVHSYRIVDCAPPTIGLLPGDGEVPFSVLLKDVPTSTPLTIHTIPTSQTALTHSIETLRAAGIGGPPPQAWEDHLPIIGG